MRHATTKHQSGAGHASQPCGKVAQTIRVRLEGDRALKEDAWNLAAAGVSLCARGAEAWKDHAGARSARGGCGSVAGEHEQTRAAFETQRQGKHQRNYGQVAGGLFETAWDVRVESAARSFGMNLIGY